MGRGQCQWEVDSLIKTRSKSQRSNSDQQEKHENPEDEYMDMAGMKGRHCGQEPDAEEDSAFDPEGAPDSTDEDDLTLSGYVQDNFDFLDQMDCSMMDSSVSSQVNEFSVEPPGNYDEEYEVMNQSDPSPTQLTTPLPVIAPPTSPVAPPTDMSPPRLTVDFYSRHAKSLSLPYMTSPTQCPDECSSEDDTTSDEHEYTSDDEDDDEDSMFVKSLPCDFFLNNLTNTEVDDGASSEDHERSEEQDSQSRQCEVSIEENDENLFVKSLSPHFCVNSLTNTEIQVDDAANVEDTQTDVQEERAPPSLQHETLVEENQTELCPMNKSPNKDLNDPRSETVTHKDDAESEERKHRKTSESSEETGPGVNTEELLQTHEPQNDDDSADVQSETVIVEEAAEHGSDQEEDLEAQCKQETVTKDEKRHEDGYEETDTSDTTFFASFSASDELAPVCDKTEHHEPEEHVTFSDPLHQDEEETSDSVKHDVCDAEEIVPPEDGRVDVVNVRHERSDDQETFQNEIDKQETIDKVDNIWDDRSEVIEDLETQTKVLEISMDNDQTEPEPSAAVNNVENETMVLQNDKSEIKIKLEDEHFETEQNQDVANDANAKDITEKHEHTPNASHSEEPLDTEVHSGKSVGSKVVTTKLPKVYQVKAVPIVPPKPQHCKLTALMLRQQQQQRVREERVSQGAEPEETVNAASRVTERRRDADDRHSPQSVCFDEAVAIATLRRGRARDNDRDRHKE